MSECKDVKCPVHGGLKTRGRIFEGKVVSTKGQKSATIQMNSFSKMQKYERFEKTKSKIHAYVPACMKISEGDTINIAECRKLSKTKNHVVVPSESKK